MRIFDIFTWVMQRLNQFEINLFNKGSKMSIIEINGEKYQKISENCDYFIVRTFSAGVFFGKIEKRDGKEVVMTEARRIWYWAGAASLSQLAMEGTSKPKECKFPIAVDRVILTEAIEILTCTKKAVNSINSVPLWEA